MIKAYNEFLSANAKLEFWRTPSLHERVSPNCSPISTAQINDRSELYAKRYNDRRSTMRNRPFQPRAALMPDDLAVLAMARQTILD
jgi:hypothetical protein